MTVIYCDLCGKSLEKGDAGCMVRISEYKADCCEECAKRMINCIKSEPYRVAARLP